MSMKLKEIRELQTADLLKKVQELKEELFVLRFQQATGQTAEANKKRVVRKDIARILTVIRERELTQ
jgi:large subunit ribosomal protein L29